MAQRIVDVFGVVGEHAERAIPAHNRVGPRKAFHQDSGDFELTCGGLAIAPFARQLVDIIDGAKADNGWIKHVVDEGLGVLARLALIAVDVVGA